MNVSCISLSLSFKFRIPGGEGARADAETFAVANFIYRRRHALRFLTALEAAMESGVLSRLWLCALFMTAGWAVLDDEMTPGEFFVVYNVLTEVDKTVARIVGSLAQAARRALGRCLSK